MKARAKMRSALLLLCVCVIAGCVAKSRYVEKAQTQLAALTLGEHKAQFFHSMAALPVAIREQIGAAADIGERFSADCMGRYSHRRFLAANRMGQTYYVAIETGGAAYHWFITRYVVDESGKVIEADRIEPSAAGSRR